MEKWITITLGLIIGYLLFRYLNKKQKANDQYSDILTNDKYKVKGQWDR